MQSFHEDLKIFFELVDQLQKNGDEKTNKLMNCYLEQNVKLLNDVISTSIYHLKRLQKTSTENDIICTQAKFTSEINQKVSLSTQHFLNVSLGHIADYNEWLKAHCDLATD
jgi:hypothetical protein